MKKETLERANDIKKDLQTIDGLHEAVKNRYWIAFSTPSRKELYISSTFRKRLLEFIEVQKQELEKEFEEL